MKVTALSKKIHRVWIEVPGEEGTEPDKVWVDVRPGALTGEVADQMQEASISGFNTDVAYPILEAMLVDWDLEEDVVGDNGQPTGEVRKLPVTREGIKKIPLSFLGLVLEGIQEDVRPNPTTGETSEDISPPMVQPAGSLSGTSS